jgi:hypothetical protein
MHVDALHICIALGPVAAYLLLLGTLNLASRPFLTTGGRDIAALGLAISGLVIVGPMELFLPETAGLRFGGWIWALLLGFYIMCITLLVLMLRPRLVIYNITMDQLRPILASIVSDLDPNARWAGESLILPQLGVQLYAEPLLALRNVQLMASGPHQSYVGWRRLENALAKTLRGTRCSRNPYGVSLMLFALMLVGMVTYCAVHDSHTVAHSLREMLRL